MSKQSKVTKQQLLRVITQLESAPHDRVRVLGDIGVSGLGAGLGAAAAGTIASAVGVTSVPIFTGAASFFGLTVVAATPVGWVIGAAAVGGTLAYGVSRLIRRGGLSEGRKQELQQVYRERILEMERLETACESTQFDRDRFIESLFDLIDKDIIKPDKAKQLIQCVESGAIPLLQAYKLVEDLLEKS